MPYLRYVLVCVCVEPSLQTLSGEILTFSTTIAEDGARLDASANGFWGSRPYFDVKVFIRLLHHIVPLLCHLCTGDLRKRSIGSLSR